MLLCRFIDSGTVEDYHRSGRRLKVTIDKALEIQDTVMMTPSLPTRRVAQVVDVSQASVSRTLRKAGYKPYKPQPVPRMLERDAERRLHFCNWFLDNLLVRRGEDVLDNVFFSDEAWVHLTYPGNRQNNRVWAKENPHITFEKTAHPAKLGIWCAVSRKRVVGPIFFREQSD